MEMHTPCKATAKFYMSPKSQTMRPVLAPAAALPPLSAQIENVAVAPVQLVSSASLGLPRDYASLSFHPPCIVNLSYVAEAKVKQPVALGIVRFSFFALSVAVRVGLDSPQER